MAEGKNTKQILIGSVISMILCCVMLLGSTYAWFQEAITARITITAETVSAALLDAEGNLLAGQGNAAALSLGESCMRSVVFYEVLKEENCTEPEKQNTVILDTEPATVWDLGKIYQTAPMTIVNTGSLQTKYSISVEGIEETIKEALVFEVFKDGGGQPLPYSGELSINENESISFSIQVYLNSEHAAIASGVFLDNIVIKIVVEQSN